MDLALSDEQEALRKSARGLLERAWAAEQVRRARTPQGSGHDPDLWRHMADLGWLGLAFPESVPGGGGGDLLDLAVVFEEAGRALVPTTLHSTVEAALLIDRAAGDDQRAELLPPVLRGDRMVSVALQEAGMQGSPVAIATTASRADDGVVVDGTKMFVPNAGVAQELVVVARDPDLPVGNVMLVVVPTDVAGVVRTPLGTFAGDAQHMVAFKRVRIPAHQVLTGSGAAWPAVALARRDATALQCVEMVGGARAVLDMTVQYVTQRHQFGRAIGSFQAVQHQVADLSTQIDAARLAAWQAVWRCAGSGEAGREVAIAKVAASDAYVDATLTAHQLHGGIGFAVDHDLHLWSDRARWAAVTHGTREEHLGRVLPA